MNTHNFEYLNIIFNIVQNDFNTTNTNFLYQKIKNTKTTEDRHIICNDFDIVEEQIHIRYTSENIEDNNIIGEDENKSKLFGPLANSYHTDNKSRFNLKYSLIYYYKNKSGYERLSYENYIIVRNKLNDTIRRIHWMKNYNMKNCDMKNYNKIINNLKFSLLFPVNGVFVTKIIPFKNIKIEKELRTKIFIGEYNNTTIENIELIKNDSLKDIKSVDELLNNSFFSKKILGKKILGKNYFLNISYEPEKIFAEKYTPDKQLLFGVEYVIKQMTFVKI